MFVTGLTYQNIIDREPALADFDTSYATSFTGLIAEAKAVIDNRLRALGYDLDRIGAKTDIWDWDNEESSIISKTVNFESGQSLLIIQSSQDIADGLTVQLGVTSRQISPNISTGKLESNIPISITMPNLDSGETIIVLISDGSIDFHSIKAYLTDPAIYFVHLFKSLEIIYESMRSNPGDLFEMKSLYYGDLYEREFNNLVTFYDADGDGVASLGEQISLNRTTLSR